MKSKLTEQYHLLELSCDVMTDADCALLERELHILENQLVMDYPSVAQVLCRMRLIVDKLTLL